LANTSQAKKRARQAEKHRQCNMSNRSKMRTSVKEVVKAIATGNVEQAKAAYQIAVPTVDSMVNKGLIHKNKAARHKSRLHARIRAMQTSPQ